MLPSATEWQHRVAPGPQETPPESSKSPITILRNLPTELLLKISNYLGAKDIFSLVLVNRQISNTLTPSLLKHALSEKYCVTALYLATARRNQPMMEILLSQGAPIVIVDYYFNALTVSSMSRLSSGALTNLIEFLLLEGGKSVILSDTRKETALHRAAGEGYEKLTRLLLAEGALSMYRDELGWTPLRWAVDGGRVTLVQLLRAHDDRSLIDGHLGRSRRGVFDRRC